MPSDVAGEPVVFKEEAEARVARPDDVGTHEVVALVLEERAGSDLLHELARGLEARSCTPSSVTDR